VRAKLPPVRNRNNTRPMHCVNSWFVVEGRESKIGRVGREEFLTGRV